jgi:hypothetical protein
MKAAQLDTYHEAGGDEPVTPRTTASLEVVVNV